VKRKIAFVLVFAVAYLASASAVLANAYTPRTYVGRWTTPGHGQTDFCVLSGIETTAQNTGVSTAYVPSVNGCNGTPKAIPSGYLGVTVSGYRDGAFCGSSGYVYSNVSTDYWQIWSTQCSNPAGSQEFHTRMQGRIWTDLSGGAYVASSPLTSPSQNY
jgi:hypothetical protein